MDRTPDQTNPSSRNRAGDPATLTIHWPIAYSKVPAQNPESPKTGPRRQRERAADLDFDRVTNNQVPWVAPAGLAAQQSIQAS